MPPFALRPDHVAAAHRGWHLHHLQPDRESADLSLLPGWEEEKGSSNTRSCAFTFLIALLLATWLGNDLLRFFGISRDAFQVGCSQDSAQVFPFSKPPGSLGDHHRGSHFHQFIQFLHIGIQHPHASIGNSRTDLHPVRPGCSMDAELIGTLLKKADPSMARGLAGPVTGCTLPDLVLWYWGFSSFDST